jgi:hypothetical protein
MKYSPFGGAVKKGSTFSESIFPSTRISGKQFTKPGPLEIGNPCSPAGDSEDFAVALKVAESFFEPSNCDHHAILRKAHHLCKIE